MSLLNPCIISLVVNGPDGSRVYCEGMVKPIGIFNTSAVSSLISLARSSGKATLSTGRGVELVFLPSTQVKEREP